MARMLQHLYDTLTYFKKILLKFNHPFWIIGFLYLIFITFASLRPVPLVTQNDLPINLREKVDYFLDKILHFGAYGLAGLWFKGLSLKTKQIIFNLFIFGALMEIGQYFMPTRSFEILDLFANLSGISFGIILASFFSINWFIIFNKFRH